MKTAADSKPLRKDAGTKKAGKPAQPAVDTGSDVHEVAINRAPVLTAWVAEVAKRQG